MTIPLAQAVVRLDPADPVGLARADLEPGVELDVDGLIVRVREAVPRGHKLALVDMAAGTEVRKYGQPIGLATRDIAAGEHVHEHDLRSLSRAGAPRAADDAAPAAAVRPPTRAGRRRRRRHPPCRRAGRDPQLRRGPEHRQLLGDRGQADRRRVLGARRAG